MCIFSAVPLFNWLSTWARNLITWVSSTVMPGFRLKRSISKTKTRPSSDDDEPAPPQNLARFHVISGDNPNSATISKKIAPTNRSGHRMFVTYDYLYVIGGYDSINNGIIYRDVWRMNLLTKTWLRLELVNPDDFPTSLASYAICQVAPFSNKVILFGGTTIPFGVNSSKLTYLLTMNSNGTVHSEKIQYSGTIRPVYGHAMVSDGNPISPSFYCIGGTTGHDFFLDIFKLTMNRDDNGSNWSWKRIADWHGAGENNEPAGLYRLECIIDNHKMLMFGGGTPEYVQDFENMIFLDMKTELYGRIKTRGDPDQRVPYPEPRRCHSITQFGRKVILAGGCGKDQFNGLRRTNQIYGDVWIFDLDTLSWKRHPSDLMIAVFFHAACITDSGCLLIHGGVSDERSSHRTNSLQALWISPPSLLHWSSEKILQEIRKKKIEDNRAKKSRTEEIQFPPIEISDLVISRSDKIFSRVVNPPA